MLTPEEEKKKREIFEAMSPKRQQRILKKGYGNWDPFQKPKEPFERIKGIERNLEQARKIYLSFFAEKNLGKPNNTYVQGVIEICQGLMRDDDRYRGMFDFCNWYREKKKEKT